MYAVDSVPEFPPHDQAVAVPQVDEARGKSQ